MTPGEVLLKLVYSSVYRNKEPKNWQMQIK